MAVKGLSQLYERRVVRKTKVIVDDNIHVLAKRYELLPSGRPFRVPKSNTVNSISAVNSISEQINPFKRQSSMCVCVGGGVCVRACVCVCMRACVRE